jgi:hypothetical protein
MLPMLYEAYPMMSLKIYLVFAEDALEEAFVPAASKKVIEPTNDAASMGIGIVI